MIGIDPLLANPEGGDFRLLPGSPAEGYGCLTFSERSRAERRPVTAASSTLPAPPGGTARDVRNPAARALEVSGPVEENTVWAADTVRVQGDVEVADGITLAVSPGVRVEFQGYFSLTVRGRLLALGEPDARVEFTSAHPDSFSPDSSLSGAWAGIRFPFTSEINEPSRLEYCVIEYAKNAGDSLRGGALQVSGFSKLSVVNSVLRRNAADFGGALACTHYAAPEITGCLIVDNVAFLGGSAVHCLDAYPRLTACTIVGNEDRNPEIFDPAAAIYAHLSAPRITGCILRDNPSAYFEPTQILYGKSDCTAWSDIGDGWPGEGNIDEDPLFAGGAPHPYALQAMSPCVNAGSPDSAGLGLPARDLAGTPRLLEGRIDMGAYEGDPQATGVESAVGPFRLEPNLPNPFASATSIRFRLAESRSVRVVVCDAAGRRVARLADGVRGPGLHEIAWNGTDDRGRPLPSGVYFARLDAGPESGSRKLIFLRR